MPLAQTFLRDTAERWGTTPIGFEPAALDALRAYVWPGNVRQLKNAVDRAAAIAVGSHIALADLPNEIAVSAGGAPASGEGSPIRSLSERVSVFEREALREVLAQTNGNQSRAAWILGIPRRTLAHKVKRHGLG